MPVRQVGRYREAGRALHGRPGRRPVGRAGDRVALPVAGHSAVPGLGGPLRSSPSGRGTGACARRRPAWGGGRPGPTGASPRCRARAGPLDRAQTAWHLVSWQALILGEIVAVYPLGLFHAPTMPVREGAPVAAGRPHAPVPPNLAGALGDPTDLAACVKFMPPETSPRCFLLRASCISLDFP